MDTFSKAKWKSLQAFLVLLPVRNNNLIHIVNCISVAEFLCTSIFALKEFGSSEAQANFTYKVRIKEDLQVSESQKGSVCGLSPLLSRENVRVQLF